MNQLTIKQWGVSLTFNASITDPTYHMEDGEAFLSTKSLDDSSVCTNYNGGPDLSFQSLQQLNATVTGDVDDGSGTPITNHQATIEFPDQFKQVGNYVYTIAIGGGKPCPLETTAQVNAFEDSISTIKAE